MCLFCSSYSYSSIAPCLLNVSNSLLGTFELCQDQTSKPVHFSYARVLLALLNHSQLPSMAMLSYDMFSTPLFLCRKPFAFLPCCASVSGNSAVDLRHIRHFWPLLLCFLLRWPLTVVVSDDRDSAKSSPRQACSSRGPPCHFTCQCPTRLAS